MGRRVPIRSSGSTWTGRHEARSSEGSGDLSSELSRCKIKFAEKENAFEETPQLIQLQIARDVPVAVVIAVYSSRSSRIFLWDTERDVFLPGQWIRSRLTLLDVSPCGRYVAYLAENRRRKVPLYIAVSRPPYLTALFFQPISDIGLSGAFFSPSHGFEWRGTKMSDREWEGREERPDGYVRPGAPFEIVKSSIGRWDFRARDGRCSASPPSTHVVDPRGRILKVRSEKIFAIANGEEVEMMDLRARARPMIAAPEEMTKWE